jgi:histidinol-phosphate/aromatic aminotransferase/cobyric acid decarboxylase-like protein/choline kinase
MQAIILAAGSFQRLSGLSGGIHKALFPVAGDTILGRMVDELLDVGVDSITVVTGHAGDQITRYLRARYPHTRLRFVHNDRYASTNNVVSLSIALDTLVRDEDDVLLVECDVLVDEGVVYRLVDHPARNVALVERFRTGMDGTVVTLTDGVVTDVVPRLGQDRDFDYTHAYKTLNLYRFSASLAHGILRPLANCYAHELDPLAYYESVLRAICNDPEQEIAAAVVSDERWIEIDDPNDVTRACFRFEPRRRAELLDLTRGGYWNFDLLDFAMMRNAYFPSEPMLGMMRHALPDLISNYGSAQHVLNQKLAHALDCRPDRLQALHGATQAYPILRRVWEGRSVAVPDPTFGEYMRLFPDATTYADEPGRGWGDLDDVARSSEVVVVVNPNNPTGSTTPTADVHDLARRHPDTDFLVDESFQAFAGGPSLLERLEREPLENVVVLTSLSKSLGSPGLRLGHLYSARRDVVDAVGAEVPIWNLGAPAEFLLELLLKFRGDLARSFARTMADREAFAAELSRVDVVAEVYPSGGNFMLVRLAGGDGNLAGTLRHRLLVEERIDVKDVTDRFGDGLPRLRIAVRLPHENSLLVHALARAGAGLPAARRLRTVVNVPA